MDIFLLMIADHVIHGSTMDIFFILADTYSCKCWERSIRIAEFFPLFRFVVIILLSSYFTFAELLDSSITQHVPGSDCEPFKTKKMLHQIIERNNNGIRLLEAGRLELAKASFKVALEQITEILHLFKDDVNSNTCQGPPPNAHVTSIIHIPISELTRGETSAKGSYIYRYALTLEINMQQREVDESALVHQCSLPLAIVVMYNLALVHHCGTEDPQSQFILVKALRLYEMAWSLLQQSHSCNRHTFSSSNAAAGPYILGMLNNMGAIHHELGQYDQAHNCFALLKSLLVKGAGVHEREADDGIMLNVMFLEKPSIAPAA